MFGINYDYAVDYYELVGASETLGKAELRKKLLQAIQKVDVEFRTTIPQRIQREAKGELRKKLGRDPTETEERAYVYEKTQDADARKRDKKFVEVSRKFQLLTKAKEILVDDANKKRQYDSFHNRQRKANCYDHTAGGTKEFRRDDHQVRKWNSCYFCSQLCLNDYLISNGIIIPKKYPNELNAPCYECHKMESVLPWKRPKINGHLYCEDCWDKIPNCSHPRCPKKGWFSSKETGDKWFCTREHLNKWLQEKKNQQNSKPTLGQLRLRYIWELYELKGYDLLTVGEQEGFKKTILYKAFTEPEFKNVISQAEALIATKESENPDEKLSAEIQKSISEIETELNNGSKIDEGELNYSFGNWQDYLLDSLNLNQLVARKKEILRDIKSIHHQQKGGKNLSQFREKAIQQIREELQAPPPIKNEELTNPDWESEINEISDELIIDEIRSKILAEIRNKRLNNSEKNNLNELFLRAREQSNWNDYPNLFSILREIKKLHLSNFYREKESEVEAIENQLQTLNPEKFQESIEQLLNYQAKDNGLNDSNTNEDVKQAIADWKANPTRENLAKAEEAIFQNVADNKIIEICQEIETKLSKGKLSKKAAKKLIDKVQEIISKNDYQALSYEKNRKKVDNFLEQLSQKFDWEEQDEEQSLLPKWFWPVAITSVIGVVAVSIVLWMKEKNREKS